MINSDKAKRVKAVVIDENKENAEKLKEYLNKKENLERIHKIGTIMTNSGGPAFALTLLSPFDIEGPTLELISLGILIAGIAMKNYSKNQLEKINTNAINTDGINLSEYQKGSVVNSVLDSLDEVTSNDTFNETLSHHVR